MTINSAAGGCVFYRSTPGFPIRTIPEPQCTWIKNFLRWKGLPITGDGLNVLLSKPVIGIVVQAETPSTQWLPGKLETVFNPSAPILKNGVVVTMDGVPGSPDTDGVTKFTTGYAHWVTLKVTAPGYYPYERSDFYAQGAAYSWRALFHYIALRSKAGVTSPSTIPPTTTPPSTTPPATPSPITQPVGPPSTKKTTQVSFLQTSWGKVMIFGGGAALVYLLWKRK